MYSYFQSWAWYYRSLLDLHLHNVADKRQCDDNSHGHLEEVVIIHVADPILDPQVDVVVPISLDRYLDSLSEKFNSLEASVRRLAFEVV